MNTVNVVLMIVGALIVWHVATRFGWVGGTDDKAV